MKSSEEQQEKLILELQHAWSQPLKKDTENRDEYWKERLKTAENIVHQTDIALRKKVSRKGKKDKPCTSRFSVGCCRYLS